MNLWLRRRLENPLPVIQHVTALKYVMFKIVNEKDKREVYLQILRIGESLLYFPLRKPA